MERALTPDEKIRRAEEIYYKRKVQDRSRSSARVNVSENKKDFGILRKMILQIIICILIYTIFYMIQNTNYIFSEDVIKKTNEILSYDINLQNLYDQTKNYLNSFINNMNNEEYKDITDDQNEEQINNDDNLSEENVQDVQDADIEPNESIGGENVEVTEEESVTLTQMEQDAKDILETKSLIVPLKGTITSRYGPRNPETPTVPKNHTGIDIAVNEGTVFIASMAGTVEKVSSERRFR